MSRSKRNLIIGSAVVLLAAAELGLNALKAPVVEVRIENQGDEPIDDLRIVYERSSAAVSRIAPGASARVFLSGRGPHALKLRFRQRGNALSDLTMDGFDASALEADGSVWVLGIKPNEVGRYVDEGAPPRWRQFATKAGRWLDKSLPTDGR